MKTLERSIIYSSPPEVVFPYLDDLGVTGMHMTQSSMMMMGSSSTWNFCWYRMRLKLMRVANDTVAWLSISYDKPEGWFYKVLSFLFADWYCGWCLKHMLEDYRKLLEKKQTQTAILN